MTFLDSYKKYLMNRGGSTKGSMVQNFIQEANVLMKTNPSYFEVRINDDGSSTPSLIIDDSKSEDIKHISLAPGYKLKRGDYIEWDDRTWLTLIVDHQGDIYYRGRMEECNIYLKWIDEFGSIQSYPSIFYFNTRSNFGVFEDKVMTMPDGRRQAALQKNEHTSKIQRGKRFIIGGEAFKVIDYDSVSDKGIVNLSFESDQIDPATDNVELGIANYFSDLADYSISILNGDFASIEVNQTLQINAQVKNKGNIIKDAIVSFSTSDNSIAEINQNGLLTPLQTGSVIVTASFENIFVNINVTITQNITNNYSVDILGDDSIVTGRTARYICQFKNNGIIYHDESIFHLFSVDGSDTSLASIVEQNPIENTCIIKAGEKVGTIKLQVSNKNGLTVGSTLIQIKPLF
ncbi:Ig-like domain-containing protein [Paenibacillus dendritiformis]|uniref:hypothetical protein n=1 Tax=Paenibacillus dendritiformis TaxID=130049 RepID=UPI00387E061B